MCDAPRKEPAVEPYFVKVAVRAPEFSELGKHDVFHLGSRHILLARLPGLIFGDYVEPAPAIKRQ